MVWALIVMVTSSSNISITNIAQFGNEGLCEVAAKKVEKDLGRVATYVVTSCIKEQTH